MTGYLERLKSSLSGPDGQTFAAVDVGSNSFHMIVARVEQGQLYVIDRLREMVRLGRFRFCSRRHRRFGKLKWKNIIYL